MNVTKVSAGILNVLIRSRSCVRRTGGKRGKTRRASQKSGQSLLLGGETEVCFILCTTVVDLERSVSFLTLQVAHLIEMSSFSSARMIHS